MDAQPGWKRNLTDPGQFSKEMAKHIENIYKSDCSSEFKSMYEIFTEAWG